MLVPATTVLPTIERGGTYEATVEAFEDEAHTRPLSLSGYTVRLAIEGLGFNLAKAVSANLISFALTEAQTAEVLGPSIPFVIWVASGSSEDPLIKGQIPVRTP